MNFSIQPKYKTVPQIPTEEDISNYTDNDLFQLLDLNNPTDRELEAKLYTLIDKYNTVKGNIGKQLRNLYINIFNRFFETKETEEEETNDDEDERKPLNEGFTADAEEPTNDPASQQTKENPTYTKNIDYTKGNLNPILKETVKRVVSIDSSFRNVKNYPYSTDFTFNLSETLHDVVSLKLYSVSIPYNWYTINQNYGSNIIYIKGNSNGINNGNFNYKINIPYGNYTASNLITAVNNSIQTNLINANTDISFGTTGVSYNDVNGRCTMTLDITNNYNETNYELYFPGFSIDPSNNRQPKQSIPELLGYKNQQYNPFTIYSNINNTDITDENINFTINNNNKTFNIIIYQASQSNNKITFYDPTTDPLSPTILYTIPISLSFENNTTHNARDIINDLNIQLTSNPNLISNYSNLNIIDISGYTGYKSYKYELNIKPNRKNTVNNVNQKMVAVFPLNDSIWTGQVSLFNFPSRIMEFQNVYSEINSFTTAYQVNNNPFIILNCIADGYKTDFSYNGYYYEKQSLNDYKIDISNSSTTGYILSEYYSTIQNSFEKIKAITSNQVSLTIGNTHDSNTLDTSFNTYINCNINKEIPSSNFYIDISSSFLSSYSSSTTTTLGFGYNLTNSSDKNIGRTSTNIINSGINVNEDNNKLFIYPISRISGDNRRMKETKITIKTGDYNAEEILTVMNNTFSNYSLNNINLKNTNITYNIEGETVIFTLSLDVRAVLQNKDYNLYFFNEPRVSYNVENILASYYNCYKYAGGYNVYAEEPLYYDWSLNDITLNTWKTHFGFIDPSYSLATNTVIKGTQSNTVIKGTQSNSDNLLQLTNDNNYFQLIPLEDPIGGVYSPTSNNIVTYTLSTLPVGNNNLYTKEQIRDAMNIVLNAPGSIARGSYVDTTSSTTLIRMNINKTFKAKDYSVVFYDETSFTKCNFGPGSSAETTTADTTLGWKMGFRSNISYDLTPENLKTNISDGATYYGDNISNSYTYDATTEIANLTGDTSVNVNLYNYFLIVLDDYTQNHLNDGLITTVNVDMDVSLPSYATKSSYKCIVPLDKYGISDTTTYNYNRLTNAQIYSANQILNTKKTKYLNNVYSSGPFIQDIFGIIPVKTAGLSYGQTYSEFGGTLQIQERVYFGPVNISRMTVRIMTDKGNTLDLNNQNWSFSLITEQLYNPNRG